MPAARRVLKLRDLGVDAAQDPDDVLRIRTLNAVMSVGFVLTSGMVLLNVALGIYDTLPWLVSLVVAAGLVPLFHGLRWTRAASWVVAAMVPVVMVVMVGAGFALQGTQIFLPVLLLMPVVSLRNLSASTWWTLAGTHTALTWLSVVVGHQGLVVTTLPEPQATYIEANAAAISIIVFAGLVSLIRHRQGAAAEALRRALAGANAAAEARIDLLSKVSHELRTPAAATLSLIEEAISATSQEDGSAALERARTQAIRQVQLLGDLVDVVSLRAGELELREQSFDLDEILLEAAREARERAENKGLSFRLGGHGGQRLGDRDRVAQIARHLLANAVDHTSTGEVAMEVSIAESGRVLLEVRDTGCGLTEGEVERVLKAFEQRSSGLTRVDRGLGLGLTLVEAAVERMGGALRLASEPGAGTTVEVELPLDPAPPAIERNWSFEGRRVLIVDDLSMNRLILRRIMESQGATCFEAEDGEIGFQLWKETAPDLVLMDMQMPVVDGL
ncbi:MAG: ATP-binding protein, partial [Myxococcota bacterium]